MIRFGLFEIDPRLGEIRKNGVKVRLEDQPFQVLLTLTRRPGEVVTRDELKQQLWPEASFGEFDSGLNTAVMKVRRALDDSPGSPRYVATVPKRGYRFVFPVETEEGASESPATAGRTRSKTVFAAAAAVLVLASAAARLTVFDAPSDTAVLSPVPFSDYIGAEGPGSFSPDGGHVAFSWSEPDGNANIYFKAVGSSERLRLTNQRGIEGTPAWSPDGARIAFMRDQSVYVVSALGGEERKIADVPNLDPRQLEWTPDGNALLVIAPPREGGVRVLHTLDVEEGVLHRLLDDEARQAPDRSARYSPDGLSLALIRTEPDRCRTFWISRPAGARPEKIYRTCENVSRIDWSPDGKDLIYGAGTDDFNSSSLWRLSASGGEPRPILGLQQSAWGPSVSATAKRLLFRTGSEVMGIRRYRLDDHDSPATRLVGSSREEIQPQYSPDGRRVAYVGNHSGSREIWTCDLDGGNRVSLTSAPERTACWPAWAPDSKRIAYLTITGSGSSLNVVASAGGASFQLTDEGVQDQRACWSGDGRWIYFTSTRSGSAQIWKIPADGGGTPHQVTQNGGNRPQMSQDGLWLYYSRVGDGIWKMPSEGGRKELVLSRKALDGAGWQVARDGIYFAENSGPESNRWRIQFHRFDSGETSLVRELQARPSWQEAIAVSPDGRQLLCSHTSSEVDLMLVENFE